MADLSATSFTTAATEHLAQWLGHLGMSPSAFDDSVRLFNPLLTLRRLYARVSERQVETDTATTFVLQAGPAFRPLQPGQHVTVGVTLNGVRHRRLYSPRAIEGASRRFAITVQRHPGGLVSNHLHDHLQAGQYLEIEQAAGHFVLPRSTPPQVLLVAGGSGITPCMSMLEHLKQHARSTRVTLIYFARSRAERIFAKQLEQMAAQWSSFHYLPIDRAPSLNRSDAIEPSPRAAGLNQALLDSALPGWAQVPAYCCGPASLVQAAQTAWQAAGASAHLHLEAFAVAAPEAHPDTRYTVTLTHHQQTKPFVTTGGQPLLVAGEQAGLALKHGCRQGICHECTCRLHRGIVRDLQSGKHICGEGQAIRLCVSSAMSDLSIESID